MSYVNYVDILKLLSYLFWWIPFVVNVDWVCLFLFTLSEMLLCCFCNSLFLLLSLLSLLECLLLLIDVVFLSLLLDLMVYKDQQRKIQTTIFPKRTDHQKYLHAQSNHPKSFKKDIVKHFIQSSIMAKSNVFNYLCIQQKLWHYYKMIQKKQVPREIDKWKNKWSEELGKEATPLS